MKTRIIKHTLIDDVWYTLEYKGLLFWHTWKDAYGYDERFYDLDKVRSLARKLTTKVIKEVVE